MRDAIVSDKDLIVFYGFFRIKALLETDSHMSPAIAHSHVYGA